VPPFPFRAAPCHRHRAALDNGFNPTVWMECTGSRKDRAADPCPAVGTIIREAQMAKTSPIEFMRQVRAETAKVVWPTRRETLMTAVMVVIMTTLLAIFFLGVDSVFDAIVQFLLSLAA
jgi:preprotein translocase subunit SecE